jgi:hypothetical protein
MANYSEEARKMPTLEERDALLEKMWAELEDVPFDPDTETIGGSYLHFPAGTDRETIWHWFDERHSKGIVYLLYGDDTIQKSRDLARQV